MIYHDEWRQENTQRNYPFADDMLLTATSGELLPQDYLIDAMLYPPGVNDQLYLHSIAGTEFFIGAVSTRSIVATGTAIGSTVRLLDTMSRPAGLLLLGSGFTPRAMQFSSAMTLFCSTCVLPHADYGVRGLVLPDGTILTGDITLKAGLGVRLTQTGNVIGIDFVGNANAGCYVVGPPLQCLSVTVEAGSMLRAFQSGSFISLSIAAEREELCSLGKYLPADDGTLPKDRSDPCEEPEEETTEEADLPAYTPTNPCGSVTGFLQLNSVSTSLSVEAGDIVNSIVIRTRGLRRG